MPSYPIRGTKVVSPYPVQLTPGESRLIFALQRVIPPAQILADCYFPKPDRILGETPVLNEADLTQIDCLAVGQAGIFVFESKDYSGWIYGDGKQRYWTQVLSWGREKHQFYNPIQQNTGHLKALRAVVGDKIPLYSVVVFSRDATLKTITNVPDDCKICTQANVGALITHINQHQHCNSSQITELCHTLNQSRINPTSTIRATHIAAIPHNKIN